MLTWTPPLRVVWRQSLSQLKPPAALAGLVAGTHALTRHTGTTASSSPASAHSAGLPRPSGELLAEGDAHKRLRHHTFAQAAHRLGITTPTDPSHITTAPLSASHGPSSASSLTIENASDGVPFFAFTPCDADDLAALLSLHLNGHRDRPGRPLCAGERAAPKDGDDRVGERAVMILRETLANHLERLAAVESLETGVPLRYTQSALRGVLQAMTHMLEDPEDARDVGPPPAATPEGLHGAPRASASTVLLMTPPSFSLAHGLYATAHCLHSSSLHRRGSGGERHLEFPPAKAVIWCPSPCASLSTQWWMWCLRETLRRDAQAMPCHTLLLANPAENVSAALTCVCLSAAPHDSHASVPPTDPRASVSVCYVARTPAAMRAQEADPRTHLPTTCAVADVSVHEARSDRPTVALVVPDGTASFTSPTAHPATPSPADVETLTEELLFQCGMCPVVPPFGPPQSPCLWGARRRCPLVLVPHTHTQHMLSRLVRQQLRGGGHRQAVMGHSLDASARLGPLRSAALVEAAKNILETATHTAHGWEQVAGGFELPLTAAAGRGGYWLPAVLHMSLSTRGTTTTCHEAVNRVCASVRSLLTDVERWHGGFSGTALFVCSYDADSPRWADLPEVVRHAAQTHDMDWQLVRTRPVQ